MVIALVMLICFVGVLLQTLSGFGFALMAMPLMTLLLGLRIAAPLVAIAGLTVYGIHLIRYRRAVNGRELLHLAAASALGIPAGFWLLTWADERTVKAVLGGILVAYAVWALARRVAVRPCSEWWGYPAGFVAGCLGGAYNTPGPPVVVYGALRQWPKDEYRAVLQTLFFVNGVLVTASHLVARHMTANVLAFYAWGVPAMLLGMLVGSRLDARVNHERFRLLVAVMILGLGLSLLLGSVPR